MPDIDLTVCLLFAVSAIIIIKALPRNVRWIGLLIACITFYALLSLKSLSTALVIILLTYLASFWKKGLKTRILWVTAEILIPLMYQKVFLRGDLFSTYKIGQPDSVYWIGLLSMSYISFNAISYLMDIRRKYVTAETNFARLTLYLLYFPIVFSGPLVRAKPFFSRTHNLEIQRGNLVKGFRLVLWGLFKNLVVGARLFALLEILLEQDFRGVAYLLVGLVFFLYLYVTFSSFISIFRGISTAIGIEIPENFKNRVYFSSSREMFWKGWHITLNSWFRDYFFYEIVRWDKKRNFTNLLLFITFIAIALWHDITWVFLIWGTLNATWLILERKFRKRFPEFKVSNWIGTVYHTVLASFLATVFISDSPANLWNSFFQTGSQNADLSAFMKPNSLIVFLAFTYMDWVEKKCGKLNISAYLDTWSEKKRILWYLLIILGIWILNDSDDLSNYYNMF